MAHFFEIPELLSLVCEQTRRSDLARLLTTSRLFFECAMPFVWRSLPQSAPIILLRLLPNADAYLNTNLNEALVQAILENLHTLDPQSLVRFNLYAIHVKRIVRHNQNKQSNVAWDRLLKLVGARPILPNLEVLKIPINPPRHFPGEINGRELISYFTAYLSPTLVEIDSTRGPDLYMEPENFTPLVSRIAQECPHLKSLKLKAWTGPSGVGHDPNKLAGSLVQFHNLCSVTLGFVALDPRVLVSLGTLPNLESLNIDESTGGEEWIDSESPPISLPDGSFPALRHLGISVYFGCLAIYQIWNINALVQCLTSISVPILGIGDPAEACNFIRTICKASPLVTDLCVNSIRSPRIDFLSSAIIDYLAQLPLERLRLSWKDLSNQYCGGEYFVRAFPNMKSLRIRGYTFSFKDLVLMAKYMPELQYLSVLIEVNVGWPTRQELPALGLAPSPSQLELHFVSSGSGLGTPNEAIEGIAAGLLALWPSGVTCVAYSRSDKGSEMGWMDRVNAELKRLRKVSGHGNSQTEVGLRKYIKRVPPWLDRV
ncbi:hypothetical protein OPQ81_001066 [Rhizoctonia solani]|nr:hypothetical protein OPQ81_001066 [Rhizoctonia solani]